MSPHLSPQCLPSLPVAASVLPFAVLCGTLAGQVPTNSGTALPKVLAIRESVLSAGIDRAESHYRRDPRTRVYVLERVEGEMSHRWSFGGEAREAPGDAPRPAVVVDKRVRFLRHGGKLFVRIEATAKGVPGREEEALPFSGVYEGSFLEGDWEQYERGEAVAIRLAAADQQRSLEEMVGAFFGAKTLAAYADSYRKALLGVMERKIAEPGNAPPEEIEGLRRLVGAVKARPEIFRVEVVPALEAEPEVFRPEGETMRSTVARQVLSLRFRAALPAPGRGP